MIIFHILIIFFIFLNGNFFSFQVILKLKVQDADAKDKFTFVKKVLKERAFLEAIKKENDEDKIDISEVNDMIVNKN